MCAGCGGRFELSARNVRLHKRNGTRPRCARCRGYGKPPKVLAKHIKWWREQSGLSPAELREVAVAVAGWLDEGLPGSDRGRSAESQTAES